jgi:hypothetical protein
MPMMQSRRQFSRRGLSFVAGLVVAPAALAQSNAPTAAARLSKPGREEEALRARTGTWDVVATMWPTPDAAPVVTRGVIAERSMIGPFLQEIMHPAAGAAVPDFRRLDYLNYDRVEGRWKYVSMDTRFPVSIMPAWSFEPATEDRITLQFNPQAFVGFGPEVEGRFMASDMVVAWRDAEHETKEQHVTMADGTGRRWLFVRYEYGRRK